MTDHDIIARVRAGQEEHFAQLVERYGGLVWALCASYVPQREDCSDMAQEVLVLAYNRLDTLKDPKAFGAWLSQLARRHCLTWLRAQSRRRGAHDRLQQEVAAVPHGESPADTLARKERYAAIRSTVAALPPINREALNLYYMEGFDTNEAAEFLGIKPGAFRKRLQIGRDLLKDRMDKELQPALETQKHDNEFSAKALAAIPFGTAPWLGRPGASATPGASRQGLRISASLKVATVLGGVAVALLLIVAPFQETVLGSLFANDIPNRSIEARGTQETDTVGANADLGEGITRAAALPENPVAPTDTIAPTETNRTHYVSGVVLWEDETPFAGAVVEVAQTGDPAASLLTHVETDQAGQFHAEGLYKRPIRLFMNSKEGAWQHVEKIVAADTSDHVLVVQRMAHVEGQVVDASNGKPIPAFHALAHHADVSIAQEGPPFTNGEFKLDAGPGLCVVRLRAPGYADTISKPFKAYPRKTSTISVTMSPESRIEGTVRDARTLQPIAGVTVAATKHEYMAESYYRAEAARIEMHAPLLDLAKSDAAGHFTIRQLASGDQYIFLQHPDYPSLICGKFVVPEGKALEAIELLMEPGTVIEGTVRQAGEPVEGIHVTADAEDEGFTYGAGEGTPTDVNGHYRITQAGGSKLILRVRLRTASGAVLLTSRRVEVAPGSHTTCDFDFLSGERSISGVAYLRGKPEAGLDIILVSEKTDNQGNAVLRSKTSSDSGGRFEFTGLPNGVYELHGSYYPDYTGATSQATGVSVFAVDESLRTAAVADARRDDVVVDIHLGSAETGRIVGTIYENGKSSPGITIVASQKVDSDTSYYAKMVTSISGEFAFDKVPAGTITLDAQTINGREPFPERTFHLEPGDVRTEDFYFSSGTGTIRAEVYLDDSPVAVTDVDGMEFMAAPLGDTGGAPLNTKKAFELENVPPGRYDVLLAIEFGGHKHVRGQEVEVRNQRATTLDLRFHSGGVAVTGTVSGASGASDGPRQHVLVALFFPGTSLWDVGQPLEPGTGLRLNGILSWAEMNVGETFTLEGVQPGAYDAVAAWFEGGLCTQVTTVPLEVVGTENEPVVVEFE